MRNKPLKRGLAPIHPGAILREDVVPATGLSKTEISDRLGISRTTLYAILDEKQPVTPAMALRLGKFCGNGPNLWLNLQRDYDLAHESERLREDLARIQKVG